MKKLTLLLLLMISTSVFANESYLCITEQQTGFNFDEQTGRYKPVEYEVHSDQKYILKKEDKNERTNFLKLEWSWNKFGEKTLPVLDCKDINENVIYGFVPFGIECNEYDHVGQHILINKKTLRFSRTYSIGYLENNHDSSYMEIGKCSPI